MEPGLADWVADGAKDAKAATYQEERGLSAQWRSPGLLHCGVAPPPELCQQFVQGGPPKEEPWLLVGAHCGSRTGAKNLLSGTRTEDPLGLLQGEAEHE